MIQASLKAAGFLVLVLAAGSAAAYDNGNELHSALNQDDVLPKFGAMTYVNGVIDGVRLGYIAAEAGSGLRFDANKLLGCMPEGVTNGQIRDVVQKYLNDNPAERHMDASVLVAVALRRAFPCKP